MKKKLLVFVLIIFPFTTFASDYADFYHEFSGGQLYPEKSIEKVSLDREVVLVSVEKPFFKYKVNYWLRNLSKYSNSVRIVFPYTVKREILLPRQTSQTLDIAKDSVLVDYSGKNLFSLELDYFLFRSESLLYDESTKSAAEEHAKRTDPISQEVIIKKNFSKKISWENFCEISELRSWDNPIMDKCINLADFFISCGNEKLKISDVIIEVSVSDEVKKKSYHGSSGEQVITFKFVCEKKFKRFETLDFNVEYSNYSLKEVDFGKVYEDNRSSEPITYFFSSSFSFNSPNRWYGFIKNVVVAAVKPECGDFEMFDYSDRKFQKKDMLNQELLLFHKRFLNTGTLNKFVCLVSATEYDISKVISTELNETQINEVLNYKPEIETNDSYSFEMVGSSFPGKDTDSTIIFQERKIQQFSGSEDLDFKVEKLDGASSGYSDLFIQFFEGFYKPEICSKGFERQKGISEIGFKNHLATHIRKLMEYLVKSIPENHKPVEFFYSDENLIPVGSSTNPSEFTGNENSDKVFEMLDNYDYPEFDWDDKGKIVTDVPHLLEVKLNKFNEPAVRLRYYGREYLCYRNKVIGPLGAVVKMYFTGENQDLFYYVQIGERDDFIRYYYVNNTVITAIDGYECFIDSSSTDSMYFINSKNETVLNIKLRESDFFVNKDKMVFYKSGLIDIATGDKLSSWDKREYSRRNVDDLYLYTEAFERELFNLYFMGSDYQNSFISNYNHVQKLNLDSLEFVDLSFSEFSSILEYPSAFESQRYHIIYHEYGISRLSVIYENSEQPLILEYRNTQKIELQEFIRKQYGINVFSYDKRHYLKFREGVGGVCDHAKLYYYPLESKVVVALYDNNMCVLYEIPKLSSHEKIRVYKPVKPDFSKDVKIELQPLQYKNGKLRYIKELYLEVWADSHSYYKCALYEGRSKVFTAPIGGRLIPFANMSDYYVRFEDKAMFLGTEMFSVSYGGSFYHDYYSEPK